MTRSSNMRRAWYGRPLCPSNPEHGPMWDYPSGYYCPHSDHTRSGEGTQAFFRHDEMADDGG